MIEIGSSRAFFNVVYFSRGDVTMLREMTDYGAARFYDLMVDRVGELIVSENSFIRLSLFATLVVLEED